jgi:putative chitinase
MPTDREAQMLLSAYQAGVTSPQELANFMAQVSVESGGLSRLDEGFRYTRGIRQITVDAGVRSALREGPEALEAARVEALEGRPERLADLMYGGRMGNDQPGDGYKYHGRGYIQLTGKNQYRAAGEALGLDLVNQPELAAQPEHAAAIAVLYWKTNVRAEDRGNVARAGGTINTGDPNLTATHADRRQTKFQEWSSSLTPEVMESLSQGEIALPVVAGARTAEDPAVRSLQQNLNTLGITDANGQRLQVDGDRGGPNSHTNEAIAAFQRQLGVEGQMSNAELLAATQAALGARRAPGVDQEPPGTPEQAAPATLPPLPMTQPLGHGDRGASVLALQEHLRMVGATDRDGNELKPDRDYGHRTKEAVEQFQLWTGRETTGAVDRGTLQALQAHAEFAASQRAQGIAPGQHLVDNLQRDAAMQIQASGTSRPATSAPEMGRPEHRNDERDEQPQRSAPAQNRAQTFPSNQPDYALFMAIQSQLPKDTPDEKTAEIMHEAKLGGIKRPDQLDQVVMEGNRTWVFGKTAGFYSREVAFDAPAPALNETLQRTQDFDQRQALHMQQFQEQQVRINDNQGGPTMSM